VGLRVEAATDGRQGVRAARTGNYGIVLLDLVLPGQDGLELLAELRTARPELPVIILTALAGRDNRLHALEAGAVDYVLMPFSLRELAARIRAQLRIAEAGHPTQLQGSDITVDLLTRRVCHHGVPVHLSTLEFRLLVHLMQRPGITHSRQDILRAVWDQDLTAGQNLVDVYVGYLRRKLPEPGSHRDSPIQTVRSRGYRFVEASSAASRT
jgi:DNA-binding response OmpR family regulator